jgi:RNA polymerase subunit RPABC4/transcription elongation factor Spt4
MTLLFLIAITIIVYYIFIYKEAYKNIFNNKYYKKCPNCSNPIEASYNVCPVCKETLKMKCDGCGNMVDKNWKYCPYCELTLKKGDSK